MSTKIGAIQSPLLAGFSLRSLGTLHFERSALIFDGTEQMAIKGGCHGGKTSFQIEDEISAELTRCTYSFCSNRGALQTTRRIGVNAHLFDHFDAAAATVMLIDGNNLC